MAHDYDSKFRFLKKTIRCLKNVSFKKIDFWKKKFGFFTKISVFGKKFRFFEEKNRLIILNLDKVRTENNSGESDHLNQSQITDEDLNSSLENEEMSVKDRTFKILTEHIFDRNAYARSYVLKIFEKLSTEIRLPHMGPYLERIVSRFQVKIITS